MPQMKILVCRGYMGEFGITKIFVLIFGCIKMREKITDVFYNNGHFEVLVYFKGTKIFLEVSLSSFVEDFFNSFNASEPIILD